MACTPELCEDDASKIMRAGLCERIAYSIISNSPQGRTQAPTQCHHSARKPELEDDASKIMRAGSCERMAYSRISNSPQGSGHK